MQQLFDQLGFLVYYQLPYILITYCVLFPFIIARNNVSKSNLHMLLKEVDDSQAGSVFHICYSYLCRWRSSSIDSSRQFKQRSNQVDFRRLLSKNVSLHFLFLTSLLLSLSTRSLLRFRMASSPSLPPGLSLRASFRNSLLLSTPPFFHAGTHFSTALPIQRASHRQERSPSVPPPHLANRHRARRHIRRFRFLAIFPAVFTAVCHRVPPFHRRHHANSSLSLRGTARKDCKRGRISTDPLVSAAASDHRRVQHRRSVPILHAISVDRRAFGGLLRFCIVL